MAKQNKASSSPLKKVASRLGDNQKAFIFVVLLVGALFYYKNLYVAASVNGKAISRWQVVNELEKRSGKVTLETLVTKELILQEAKKRNVAVSDQDVNQELARIEASVKEQGGNLEQVLTAQGMTREDLREQVMIQKLLEKLLADKLKVTEGEIDQFMEENAENLPETTDSAALRTSIRQQLEQNKLSEQAQALVDSLKKSAKVDYFVTY